MFMFSELIVDLVILIEMSCGCSYLLVGDIYKSAVMIDICWRGQCPKSPPKEKSNIRRIIVCWVKGLISNRSLIVGRWDALQLPRGMIICINPPFPPLFTCQ